MATCQEIHEILDYTNLLRNFLATSDYNYDTIGLQPMSFVPVYCATKHGVVAFTKSLKGHSTLDGVRINAVCPDPVDTPLFKNFLDKNNDENSK